MLLLIIHYTHAFNAPETGKKFELEKNLYREEVSEEASTGEKQSQILK